MTDLEAQVVGVQRPRVTHTPPVLRGGFTLVELLLVVTILSVVAAAVVVSFAGRQDRVRLRFAAEDLAAGARLAASEAQVRRVPHRVQFRRGGYVVLAQGGAAQTALGGPSFESVRGIGGAMHRWGEGIVGEIERDSGVTEPLPDGLDFYPPGEEQRGFAGTIALRNRQGESLHVRIMPQTRQVIVTR